MASFRFAHHVHSTYYPVNTQRIVYVLPDVADNLQNPYLNLYLTTHHSFSSTQTLGETQSY